ncbi:MAG: transketolase, partial [Chloroflexi bacterium]|nr:transketolase [Chloroflexota bacterium]
AGDRGQQAQAAWQSRWNAYAAAYPQEAARFQAEWAGDLPPGWDADLPSFAPDKPIATRVAGGQIMNAIAPRLPALIGGSADLAASNRTALKDLGNIRPGDYAGRNIHFGIREHAMGAILNGLALHGGLIPFGATFLVFSDYMRPSIRLAAMMGLRVIYVFTHDSIGLGEDGPTHQPVEQLATLRAIPNLTVIRPADANETVVAWRMALERRAGPTALALTRQGVPVFDRSRLAPAAGLARGAYILADAAGTPDVILIATGSEVSVALGARELLAAEGIQARVVSMPSWGLFDAQPPAYRDGVLPPGVLARVAVEAGVSQGWHRYVGLAGDVVGLDRFGASAPYQTLMREFGFTPEHVAARARTVLGR